MAFAQYDDDVQKCDSTCDDCLTSTGPMPEKQSAQSVDWQSTKKSVSERNRHMFNNSDMSDISFTCEGSGKKLYAHKYVLGTSSAVFRAMFYGDLAEKNSIVHLSDTDEKSLEEFLRFLYTDECNLTTDNAISVMYLSKKYIVPSLTEKCVNNLASSIKAENVMSILEQATHFDERKLEMSCWKFIESNTKRAVASTDFNNISQKTLASLLRRNDLDIVEVELFRAVLKWSDFQCSKKDDEATRENRRSVIGEAIYDLRFLAMTQREFAQTVATSGLLTAEEIVPIYNKFNGIDSRDLKWKLSKRRSNWLNCQFDTDSMANVAPNAPLGNCYEDNTVDINMQYSSQYSHYSKRVQNTSQGCVQNRSSYNESVEDTSLCDDREDEWPLQEDEKVDQVSSYNVSAVGEISSYDGDRLDQWPNRSSYSAVQNSSRGDAQNSAPFWSQRRQKGKAKHVR